MKLEEGKFYQDGFGDVVGPMKRDDGCMYPFFATIRGHSFTEGGKFIVDCVSRFDLIEEVPVPGKVVTLYCGEDDTDGEWYASETPANTDTLKITFNVKDGKVDPSSVRMEALI